MSSIDISAVDVDASFGSSWDGSDSELEVEVTQVVQQQEEEEEEEEELDLELDESHKSSKTWYLEHIASRNHTTSRNRAEIEQKSSGQNKNRNNWYILASISGSRSARNKHMLRAEMPL